MAQAATSEVLVGQVLQLRGEIDAALEHYRRSEELRKRILEKYPQGKNAVQNLEAVRTAIDQVRTGSGDGLKTCAKS
jgi:hypothetical protein